MKQSNFVLKLLKFDYKQPNKLIDIPKICSKQPNFNCISQINVLLYEKNLLGTTKFRLKKKFGPTKFFLPHFLFNTTKVWLKQSNKFIAIPKQCLKKPKFDCNNQKNSFESTKFWLNKPKFCLAQQKINQNCQEKCV